MRKQQEQSPALGEHARRHLSVAEQSLEKSEHSLADPRWIGNYEKAVEILFDASTTMVGCVGDLRLAGIDHETTYNLIAKLWVLVGWARAMVVEIAVNNVAPFGNAPARRDKLVKQLNAIRESLRAMIHEGRS